jgi:hypothetical protein
MRDMEGKLRMADREMASSPPSLAGGHQEEREFQISEFQIGKRMEAFHEPGVSWPKAVPMDWDGSPRRRDEPLVPVFEPSGPLCSHVG